MNEATKKAIEAVSEQAAEKATNKEVECALKAFGGIVDKKVSASKAPARRHSRGPRQEGVSCC